MKKIFLVTILSISSSFVWANFSGIYKGQGELNRSLLHVATGGKLQKNAMCNGIATEISQSANSLDFKKFEIKNCRNIDNPDESEFDGFGDWEPFTLKIDAQGNLIAEDDETGKGFNVGTITENELNFTFSTSTSDNPSLKEFSIKINLKKMSNGNISMDYAFHVRFLASTSNSVDSEELIFDDKISTQLNE